jgi:murein DD-endopeptidase MepM/ murein hydrolase activator NlpD
MKGGKILGGCLIATMLGVLIFIILSTLVVEAARQSSPFGQEQIKEWMLGTPQPVGSEFSDNGYMGAGVGVGWKDFTHPDDTEEPWGVPFDFIPLLNCRFCDPNYTCHTGTDFKEGLGTPVYSTMSGMVVWAGRNGPWGNLVVVENNGIQTWYAHFSEIDVVNGMVINKGTLVGKIGTTGNSTGYHLHYAIKKKQGEGAVWLNPERFFGPENEAYYKVACPYTICR